MNRIVLDTSRGNPYGLTGWVYRAIGHGMVARAYEAAGNVSAMLFFQHLAEMQPRYWQGLFGR